MSCQTMRGYCHGTECVDTIEIVDTGAIFLSATQNLTERHSTFSRGLFDAKRDGSKSLKPRKVVGKMGRRRYHCRCL